MGPWSEGSRAFNCLPDGSGEFQSTPSEVRQEYVQHLPMTPVWIELHLLEVRHRAIFFEDGAMA